ncbi:hypothetical protein SJAG_01594 [Schizosaccharomyces japonicus yFS275]|uniref:Mitochondrial fission 1 protein n=1 Tax=Schizosaccharomyces japonicus (strain yFS275 / FY16936) TaxID=402676 RepID=B6JYD4_SCHJY|nr:hypothetical protein SJAG_01594 [Schizosaccharomyces japonicus yFS275]EEB06552.1 hypothetical protein SJAG_01594 [Schizosaccharomyces japonicus yFS275]
MSSSSSKPTVTLSAQFEAELPDPSADIMYLYGMSLVSAKCIADIEHGIRLLRKCMTVDAARHRDCVYQMAQGYANMNRFEDAEHCTETLLNNDPNDKEARALHEKVACQHESDAALGLGMVACATATCGLLISSWVHRILQLVREW